MSKERIVVLVLVCFTLILLVGFLVIPNDILAQTSGVLAVALPALVKGYQAYRKLQPRFEMDLEDVDDVVITLPRNICRISMRVKNAKSITIEGAGDDIVIGAKKDDHLEQEDLGA